MLKDAVVDANHMIAFIAVATSIREADIAFVVSEATNMFGVIDGCGKECPLERITRSLGSVSLMTEDEHDGICHERIFVEHRAPQPILGWVHRCLGEEAGRGT